MSSRSSQARNSGILNTGFQLTTWDMYTHLPEKQILPLSSITLIGLGRWECSSKSTCRKAEAHSWSCNFLGPLLTSEPAWIVTSVSSVYNGVRRGGKGQKLVILSVSEFGAATVVLLYCSSLSTLGTDLPRSILSHLFGPMPYQSRLGRNRILNLDASLVNLNQVVLAWWFWGSDSSLHGIKIFYNYRWVWVRKYPWEHRDLLRLKRSLRMPKI